MDISAKKCLGQNFLKDEAVLKKISNSVKTLADDLIIEIGPGKGALTKYLIQKPSKLLAYEIDERMKDNLAKYENEKCHIIFDDFLKRDLKDDLSNFNFQNVYIIANIPYYITTPILTHILESDLVVETMVLLVQKEVAKRFCAKPKTKMYGYFTVLLNHYYNSEILFDVLPSSFSPAPKVVSSVIKLERKKEILDLDIKKFQHFLSICFANKRKTLKNNLKDVDFNKVLDVLSKYSLSSNVRAEDISYEVFVELFFKLV